MWIIGGVTLTGEKPTCSEKTCPGATVSTTDWNVDWTGLDWTGLDLVAQRCEIGDAEDLRSQSFEGYPISNAQHCSCEHIVI